MSRYASVDVKCCEKPSILFGELEFEEKTLGIDVTFSQFRMLHRMCNLSRTLVLSKHLSLGAFLKLTLTMMTW